MKLSANEQNCNFHFYYKITDKRNIDRQDKQNYTNTPTRAQFPVSEDIAANRYCPSGDIETSEGLVLLRRDELRLEAPDSVPTSPHSGRRLSLSILLI